jgi:hypothetical protein
MAPRPLFSSAAGAVPSRKPKALARKPLVLFRGFPQVALAEAGS